MRALRRFLRRLSSWARIQRDEERLRLEIEEHLALQTAENIRAGLSPAEARREAMLKFGAVEAMKEDHRQQRGLPTLERLIQDTRYALRRLRMAPAFTIATVLILALGIGATTSIFTLVHAVLLKSLPVANPGELLRLGREPNCCYYNGYSFDKEFSIVSYDLYKYLRDNTNGFAELAAFQASFQTAPAMFGVRRSGSAEAAKGYGGEFVSGNYFTMFGLGAYAGRTLTTKDDQPSALPVAVMSYRLWREGYRSDPSVVGSVFSLNKKPFTVVGIAPPGFFGDTLLSSPPDFFLPLNTEPYVEVDADLYKYNVHWLDLIGRIQPGANPTAIEAQMRVELKQWLLQHWSEMGAADRARFPQQTLYLMPGGAGITAMREQYGRWLQILMTITAVVLLIVCANVANLMLIRSLERRRQTSLSMALGAPVSRVLRESLIESMLLSSLGGAAGLAVAFAGTCLILRFAFISATGSAGVPISAWPSMPVLLFALITSIVTGIVFGGAPAWIATRVDPIEALRGANRSTSRAGSLPRKILAAFQAALSLALLSAAGLLATALQRLEHQDFGFEPDGRIVANINARLAGYQTGQLPRLYRRIHDAVESVPGVSSVALCLYAPPLWGWGSGVFVDGRPAPQPGDDNSAAWDRITAGYFDVVGTPILSGRGITDEDTAISRKIAVVNEALARKFFGTENPIGRHFGDRPGASGEFEIVGVTRDARYFTHGLDRPTGPMFFLPAAQADYTRTNIGSLFLHTIVVQTKPGASVPAAAIVQAMVSVDPNLPIISMQTLREQVTNQFTQQRLIARLTSLFGILSLVLASIGIYGVTAYNAGRRVSEIGVRMALGAHRGDVIRLVLRGTLGLLVIGLSIGLPLALAAGRFLASQLYGMNPNNPAVTLWAVAALALPALAAALIPALRASRISPLDALRTE
jgi:predicted permease